MLVRLTMICCGVTAASRRGFFPADEPLEDRALPGIQAVSKSLGTADRIWTSSALRARQTSEVMGLQATEHPVLCDQDFGAWAGMAFREIEQTSPEAAHAWLNDPDTAPPNGESFRGVAARASRLLGDLVAEPGHTIAVTHPAMIRAVILQVLKAPLDGFRFIDVEPLSLADVRSDGMRWMLRACGVRATVS